MSGLFGGLLFLFELLGRVYLLIFRCVLFVLIGKNAFKSFDKEPVQWRLAIGSTFTGIIITSFIAVFYHDELEVGPIIVLFFFIPAGMGFIVYLLDALNRVLK